MERNAKIKRRESSIVYQIGPGTDIFSNNSGCVSRRYFWSRVTLQRSYAIKMAFTGENVPQQLNAIQLPPPATHMVHISDILRCCSICFRQNDKIACNIWRKRIEFQHPFNARAAHQLDFNFSWEFIPQRHHMPFFPIGISCIFSIAICDLWFLFHISLLAENETKNHKALNLRMASRARFGSSMWWKLGRVCVWPSTMQLLHKYLQKRVICTCRWPMCSALDVNTLLCT